MSFLELARKRYSVRAYKPDPVEDEKLQQVLEAARLAPSACNLQPFQFIVIHTRGREAELRRIYSSSWFVQAPIVICACGMPSQSWRRRDGKNYCDVDVTIAMDHLILAAADLGLGTCWIGASIPMRPVKCWDCPMTWSRWLLHRSAIPRTDQDTRAGTRWMSWYVTSAGENRLHSLKKEEGKLLPLAFIYREELYCCWHEETPLLLRL